MEMLNLNYANYLKNYNLILQIYFNFYKDLFKIIFFLEKIADFIFKKIKLNSFPIIVN